MVLTEKHHPVFLSVLQFMKRKELVQTGDHVIVAVSGGIDSMVLMDILANAAPILGCTLSVAHVNHRLRGRSSDADERFVKGEAKKRGLEFRSGRVDVKRTAEQEKLSVQEAARRLRYGFFDQVRMELGARHIATAHHADDNAETMLFHFVRGTGIKGLAGIPAVREAYIRPLLGVRRKEIAAYAKSRRIQYREDASNRSTDYTRNYIRRSVIPLLERRVNPGLSETLRKESELFSRLTEHIGRETEAAVARTLQGGGIDIEALASLPPFLRSMVVKEALERNGIEPVFTLIEALEGLAKRQKGSVADIDAGRIAERTDRSIIIRSRGTRSPFETELTTGGTVTAGAYRLSLSAGRKDNRRTAGSSVEQIDAAAVTLPLTVRSWRAGDAFVPLGMSGRKKLSDLFAEKKLTAAQKSEVPIVLTGDRIVWVGGLRLDERSKVTAGTRRVLTLTMTPHGDQEDHHRQ